MRMKLLAIQLTIKIKVDEDDYEDDRFADANDPDYEADIGETIKRVERANYDTDLIAAIDGWLDAVEDDNDIEIAMVVTDAES